MNKRLFIAIIVASLSKFGATVYCQESSSLEALALTFFCQNVDTLSSYTGDSKIVLNSSKLQKPAYLYDVADCFGLIDLLSYEIGDNQLLDSLAKLPSVNAACSHKLDLKALTNECDGIYKSGFLKKKPFFLSVYKRINYLISNQKVVQLILTSKDGKRIIFSVLFNEKKAILDYCISFIQFEEKIQEW